MESRVVADPITGDLDCDNFIAKADGWISAGGRQMLQELEGQTRRGGPDLMEWAVWCGEPGTREATSKKRVPKGKRHDRNSNGWVHSWMEQDRWCKTEDGDTGTASNTSSLPSSQLAWKLAMQTSSHAGYLGTLVGSPHAVLCHRCLVIIGGKDDSIPPDGGGGEFRISRYSQA